MAEFSPDPGRAQGLEAETNPAGRFQKIAEQAVDEVLAGGASATVKPHDEGGGKVEYKVEYIDPWATEVANLRANRPDLNRDQLVEELQRLVQIQDHQETLRKERRIRDERHAMVATPEGITSAAARDLTALDNLLQSPELSPAARDLLIRLVLPEIKKLSEGDPDAVTAVLERFRQPSPNNQPES